MNCGLNKKKSCAHVTLLKANNRREVVCLEDVAFIDEAQWIVEAG